MWNQSFFSATRSCLTCLCNEPRYSTSRTSWNSPNIFLPSLSLSLSRKTLCVIRIKTTKKETKRGARSQIYENKGETERFDSINAAYNLFFFFYFLASRVIIQSAKSVGFTLWSSSAIKIADQTEPSERWKNSSTDHSDDRKIRLVKLLFYRSSYDPLISRFFFFYFFSFFFLYATIIEWGMARDRPWKYRAWFVIYAISVVPFPFRFFSSPFCLLLVKFCFTSINHAMIIYEESSI